MKNNLTKKIVLITLAILAFGAVLGFFNRTSHNQDKSEIPKLTWQANTYVYDKAKLLSDGTKDQLNQNLGQLDQGKKAQVIVLTVDTLGGQTIETYANTIFNKTGIGDKQTDNVPYRAKDDYDTAVLKTTAAFTGVLTGQTPVSDPSTDTAKQTNQESNETSKNAGSPLPGLILLGVIIAVIFFFFFTGHGDILLWILMLFFNNRGGGGSGGFGGGSSGGGGFGGGSSSGGGAGR